MIDSKHNTIRGRFINTIYQLYHTFNQNRREKETNNFLF